MTKIYWNIAEITNVRLAMKGCIAVFIDFILFGLKAYPFI
tara:strand:+ start:294 stop:413 length:120 start_codon:yes stop_codon:yes gene_type:complete